MGQAPADLLDPVEPVLKSKGHLTVQTTRPKIANVLQGYPEHCGSLQGVPESPAEEVPHRREEGALGEAGAILEGEELRPDRTLLADLRARRPRSQVLRHRSPALWPQSALKVCRNISQDGVVSSCKPIEPEVEVHYSLL